MHLEIFTPLYQSFNWLVQSHRILQCSFVVLDALHTLIIIEDELVV